MIKCRHRKLSMMTNCVVLIEKDGGRDGRKERLSYLFDFCFIY